MTDPETAKHFGTPAIGKDQIEQHEVELVDRTCGIASATVAARWTVCPSAVRPLTMNDAMLSSSSTTRMRTLVPLIQLLSRSGLLLLSSLSES